MTSKNSFNCIVIIVVFLLEDTLEPWFHFYMYGCAQPFFFTQYIFLWILFKKNIYQQ